MWEDRNYRMVFSVEDSYYWTLLWLRDLWLNEIEKDWKWHEDEEINQKHLGPKITPPEEINQTDLSICQQILHCEITGKPYKIIPQEFALYQKLEIPVPHTSANQRHKERMAMRNPRKLWHRNCDNCAIEITTTYAPDRPEKIYCEKCYLSILN